MHHGRTSGKEMSTSTRTSGRVAAAQLATTTLLGLACLTFGVACSGKAEAPEVEKVPVTPTSAAPKPTEAPIITEDGELIFREDFETGELPAGVIQGTEETP